MLNVYQISITLGSNIINSETHYTDIVLKQ